MDTITAYTVRAFDIDTLSEYEHHRLDTISQASAWYRYEHLKELGGSNYLVTYEVKEIK